MSLFASPEKRTVIVCLLLVGLTMVLYSPANRHPFVNYDDDRYVTENIHVRQGLTAQSITWALTSTEQGNWHPLTWMSHALDCTLFGLNPAGHHFTSILLHSVNTALLFLFLMWSTNRLGPSAFVAVLFAVHPINVESVAWVAERKNVLCTTFFFMTLLAYGWYVRRPGWRRYLAVLLLFVAGLASKPMVITLPFVLLILDYWRFRDLRPEPRPAWSRLVLEKVPLFALSAISALITVKAQRAGGAIRSVAQFPLSVRLANAIVSYVLYLWKLIWPARLAPLYPYPANSIAAWQVLVAAALLVTITILVLVSVVRRDLLVGWLWFLGTLVPVIGLVQVGDAAMADRYAYIPEIGVFFMIAFGTAYYAGRVHPAWVTVPAVLIVVTLAFATNRQIGYWQNNLELWSYTLQVTQNNFIAEDNLGGALLMLGKEDEAYRHFEAAVLINPSDPMSHSNLGAYEQSHGKVEEAIAQYKTAIQLTTDAGLLAQNYANLGAAQRAAGEDAQASDSFQQSLRLNPRQFNAWLGLGLLARTQGNLQEAILDFSRSVEIQPTDRGYLELGRAFAAADRPTEALAALNEALRISPDMSEAHEAVRMLSKP